jgi:y4mF family transcriptional regulator
MKTLSEFVRDKRKEANLTQEEFAERAGVALTVVRKIEQGKENLNLERVNQVLKMFGHVLTPVNSKETRRSSEEKCHPASFDWPPGSFPISKKE